MAKDKFRKRKEQKRLIRGEMVGRGIRVVEVAARLRHPGGKPYTVQAVYKGMTSSPRVVAALISAGVPARLFGKAAPGTQSPATPPDTKGRTHRPAPTGEPSCK